MSEASESSKAIIPLPQELLLCIFIHGFKGDDETFGDFPARLQHILTETIDDVKVECLIFPQYETKGELNAAVERFADWLATLTVEREVAHGMGGGAGKAKIVLCGHSMGGLLAADTFLAMANSRPDPAAPLWPRIIACLAFDTPYLGIHPHVFSSGANKAIGYAQTARDIAASAGVLGTLGGFAFGKKTTTQPSHESTQREKEQEARGLATAPPPMPAPEAAFPPESSSGTSTPKIGWQKWAPVAYGAGAAILAGAAASAAYYSRDHVAFGWSWAMDHMKYVRNLWDEQTLKDRVESVVQTGEELGVVFKIFYTYIPGKPPANPNPRTFIILPQAKSQYEKYFIPAHNRLAVDEVAAHTTMFQATGNDGYYALGLQTAQAIRDAVMLARGERPTQAPEDVKENLRREDLEDTKE
ncbi:hypothetical protein M422DRAFT_773813 [Sphaerobolus stellatus SS14]|nr:hypothetical protein M422DRAFT_773813 [Sphaerobolus stellatus SS14]